MNVFGITPRKAMTSEALLDIMTAIGLKMGEKPEDLRYGKIYIAADEDEDGKNIVALLVNFFYRFWPDLFRGSEPIVYKFSTPFVILSKGKQRKYVYADDYDDFQSNIEKYKGWDVRRAKGLGSLEPEDWEHALKKPVVVPLMDDGEMKETLDLIFNNARADDRKEWLADV